MMGKDNKCKWCRTPLVPLRSERAKELRIMVCIRCDSGALGGPVEVRDAR